MTQTPHYTPQNHGTAHLPHLSQERIAQMADYACSFAQDPVAQPASSRAVAWLTHFRQRLAASVTPHPYRTGFGVMAMAAACLALFIALPAQTPIRINGTAGDKGITAVHTMARTATTTDYQHDLSEYLIGDFLDEMV